MNNIVEKIALVLANIGAINWGLDELGYNVVDLLLGSVPILVTIIYYVIAVCGIWGLVKLFK
ncbi:MAG: DUF378 domain-containing protein [Nanoarchaeota archaeon]